ncbi:MAG: hypothetical protein WC184_07305 [Acidimicrobiia bacterium]
MDHEVTPSWLVEAAQQVIEVCHQAATEQLELLLPAIQLQVSMVLVGQEILRTDYQRTIMLAISDIEQALPPPVGMNLIYGLAHEVGHLVIVRSIPEGASLAVVWDEAFAHHLALNTFFPALSAHFGNTPWPGETAGWQERQVSMSNQLHFANQNQQLQKMAAQVSAASSRLGSDRALLNALGVQSPSSLGLLSMERTLRRLKHSH